MCPYYMMYGMTYDEFWHESLDRLEAYWQKRQFEIEAKNQEMWLQGLYNRAAIGAALNKKNKYRHENDVYTEMTLERYVCEAYKRACRVAMMKARA